MSSEINAEWSYWYVVMTDIKSEDTLLKDTPWTSKKAIFFSNYFDRLKLRLRFSLVDIRNLT